MNFESPVGVAGVIGPELTGLMCWSYWTDSEVIKEQGGRECGWREISADGH